MVRRTEVVAIEHDVRTELAPAQLVVAPDTHVRAPICLQICSAARATPPPMPQINTSSPACTRDTTIPASGERRQRERRGPSNGTIVGIARTFAAGTTRYCASVPGKCRRATESRASGCSPSRQYSHVSVAQPGVHHDVTHADRVDISRRRRQIPLASAPNTQGGMVTPGRPATTNKSRRFSRRGADANAHVARPTYLRHGKVVAQLETIEPAMTGDRECLHEKPAEAVILRPLGKLAGSRWLLVICNGLNRL
jgi:hypothetical protein